MRRDKCGNLDWMEQMCDFIMRSLFVTPTFIYDFVRTEFCLVASAALKLMASSSIPLPITDYTGMSRHSGLSLAIKLQPHFSLATPVALYPHFYSKASHLGIGVMSILFYSKCSKIYIPLYFYFACSGFVFCSLCHQGRTQTPELK